MITNPISNELIGNRNKKLITAVRSPPGRSQPGVKRLLFYTAKDVVQTLFPLLCVVIFLTQLFTFPSTLFNTHQARQLPVVELFTNHY